MYAPPHRKLEKPPLAPMDQMYLDVKHLTCTLWDSIKAATEITVAIDLAFSDLDIKSLHGQLRTVETIMQDVLGRVRHVVKDAEQLSKAPSE